MQLEIEKIYLSAEQSSDDDFDYNNGNTDVLVKLQNGDTYVAAFFTYQQIPSLIQEHQQNGAYLQGAYFQAPNMLLIDTCQPERVRRVVKHLMEEGDFLQVFRKL
ncbi:MAG: hypothetical protein AAGG75_05330 [Bacteroidota bacterium]